jgi:thiamine kinase-like enzyme
VEGPAIGSPTVDPDLRAVVDAMPGWSRASSLKATPISGGITNRNFRVDVDGEPFVVRIPGPRTELLGIDREAEHRAAAAAARAGVGPEVIAFLPEQGSLVTRFVDGEPIPEETMGTAATLGLVVPAIRAIHQGEVIPGTFSPFRVVEEYRAVAASHGVDIPAAFDHLMGRARDIEAAMGAFEPRPCHNDLLNANFLRRGDRVFIVDYEYAGMGDILFDLANLSVNHGFDDLADRALLEAYFGQVTSRDLARQKLMRVMSDFREAMWGVVQQGLSTLDFDYVDYANRHFARCAAATRDDRFEGWLREAAE